MNASTVCSRGLRMMSKHTPCSTLPGVRGVHQSLHSTRHGPTPQAWIRLCTMRMRFGIALCALGAVAILEQVQASNSDIFHPNHTLYTSSVAYCEAPGPLLLQSLDLKYSDDTHTLDFDVRLSSTTTDLTYDTDFMLYAYGRKFVKVHQDLCALASGSFCHIPNYNFSGSARVHVPDSISSDIPRIVYTVPDIEALAMLRLYDSKTKKPKGCIQVQISNSMTVDLPGVTYGVGAFVIAATVASLITSAWTNSLSALQWRVVDVVTTMQLTPMASMLTIIVPRVVHAFSRRFGWIVGLWYIESIVSSIFDARQNTGSKDLNINFGSLMEAEYSRLANFFPAEMLNGNDSAEVLDVNDVSSLGFNSLLRRKLYAPNTGPGGEMDPGKSADNVVWAVAMDGFSQSGIFYYAASLNISPYSAFLTSLVTWLMAICIAIGLALLATIPVVFLTRTPMPYALERLYVQWVRPLLLRILASAMTPVLIFAFFQFAHSTGWLSHFIAALTCFAIVCVWSIILAQQWVQVHRSGPDSLYYIRSQPWDLQSAALHIGSISHPWRPKYWWFWTVMHGCMFLRACFIGFAQKHDYGLRQSAGLLVTDFLLFAVLVVCRPGRDIQSNVVQCLLCAFRVVIWALCIALSTEANVWGIPRAIVGFVLLAVLSLAIVFIFFVFLLEIVQTLFSRRQRWKGDYQDLYHVHSET